MKLGTHQPDWKLSLYPNPNLNLEPNTEASLRARGERVNWMALTLSSPLCLLGSTIPTGNRNTRSRWSSLMSSVPTIRLENPDYQVQLDGTGVSHSKHRERSCGSHWPSLVSPENDSTVILATRTNEALVASVPNDSTRLHSCTGHLACAPFVARERPLPQSAGASALRRSLERRT